MRVALDANVIVAAFAARGLCESVLESCLRDHELIVSDHVLMEVHKHLVREIKVPVSVAGDIVGLLREQATLFEPISVSVYACRERDGLPVLEVALACKADCIVTGDGDLLVLWQLRRVPIYSPRAFADALR